MAGHWISSKSNMGFCLGNSLDGRIFCRVVYPCNEDLNSKLISGYRYSCITFPALSSRLHCACFIRRRMIYEIWCDLSVCPKMGGVQTKIFFLCLVFKKKMCHGKQPFVKEFFFHLLTSINLNLYLGISHPPHITRLSYRTTGTSCFCLLTVLFLPVVMGPVCGYYVS